MVGSIEQCIFFSVSAIFSTKTRASKTSFVHLSNAFLATSLLSILYFILSPFVKDAKKTAATKKKVGKAKKTDEVQEDDDEEEEEEEEEEDEKPKKKNGRSKK